MTELLERLGPYICYVDADTDEVPAWTETGAWVGVADTAQDSWADYLAACTDGEAGPPEGS
ncbi:hypothetical protein [Streptomyces chartreusis]|uniref:hypothetical protein n=1 Tax=Streptomyces chartreusis TaxID=1969 RepID=UPI0037AF993A